MPRSPWLAIDAATPPALRARELRREWEQFVSGGGTNGVRAPVADSWRRSLDAGVDPSGSRLAPAAADRDEAYDALGGASTGRRGAADPPLSGEHRRRVRPPDRRQRRGRGAAPARRQRSRPLSGGRLDELHRGRPLERGRRRDERHRDGAGGGSRGADLRHGALHRGGSGLDLLGRTGPRPGDGRAARRRST